MPSPFLTPSPPRRSRLRQTIRSAMAATLPRRLFLVRGSSSRRTLHLTFDDGPHPEYTPRLLDQLARYQVPATFFLIGGEAARYPELVRRISDEGHELGNHTWHHHPPHEVTAGALAEEIRRTQDLLAELTGRMPQWFRPPLGKLTAAKLWRVWTLGLSVALWSRDPRDYEAASVADLRARLDRLAMQAGDIVLLHDNRPFAPDCLEHFITRARAANLRFAPLEAWKRSQAG